METAGAKNEGKHSRTPIYLSPGKVTESRQQIILNIVNFGKNLFIATLKHIQECVGIDILANILATFTADVMTVILNGNGDDISNESGGVTCKTISFYLHKQKFIGDTLCVIHFFKKVKQIKNKCDFPFKTERRKNLFLFDFIKCKKCSQKAHQRVSF